MGNTASASRVACEESTIGCDPVVPLYERRAETTFDPARLLEVVNGGHIEHRLVEAKRFGVVHERLQLGSACLDSGDYIMPVLATGSFPPGMLSLGVTLRSNGPVKSNGYRIAKGEIQVYAEGEDVFYRSEAGVAWAALTVPRDVLQRHAVNLLGHPLTLLERGTANAGLPPASADRLVNSVRDLLDRAGASAKEGTGAVGGRALEGEVIEVFVGGLAAATGASVPDSHVADRNARVRTVIEFLRTRLDRPFVLAEICEVTGLPARTLQHTFQQLYGLTPRQWFQAERLCRVRSDLLDRRGEPGDVTRVAMRWGFYHLGRFSQSYREHFGESPSETFRSAPLTPRILTS